MIANCKYCPCWHCLLTQGVMEHSCGLLQWALCLPTERRSWHDHCSISVTVGSVSVRQYEEQIKYLTATRSSDLAIEKTIESNFMLDIHVFYQLIFKERQNVAQAMFASFWYMPCLLCLHSILRYILIILNTMAACVLCILCRCPNKVCSQSSKGGSHIMNWAELTEFAHLDPDWHLQISGLLLQTWNSAP